MSNKFWDQQWGNTQTPYESGISSFASDPQNQNMGFMGLGQQPQNGLDNLFGNSTLTPAPNDTNSMGFQQQQPQNLGMLGGVNFNQIASIGSGLINALGAFTAWKNHGLAKESLKNNQNNFERNFNAAASGYNQRLEHLAIGRHALHPGLYGTAEEQVEKHGVAKIGKEKNKAKATV